MYFPKLKMNKDELDVLVLIVTADYSPKNKEETAKLISSNFNLVFEDILNALNSTEEECETPNKQIKYDYFKMY